MSDAERIAELEEMVDRLTSERNRLATERAELLKACETGKAYFDEMKRQWEDGEGVSSEDTITGQSLDELFEKWQSLTDAAIAKAKGEA